MKEITISLEEYKELLMIKGKYEELKEDYAIKNTINWNGTPITYLSSKETTPYEPYKVTCDK